MEVGKESIDLGLVVRNLDACRRFYGETLGFPFEGELRLGATTMYRYHIGSTVLKLVAGDEQTPQGPTGIRAQTGLRYFTVTVPDLEATVAMVRSQGIEPTVPVREARPGVWIAMLTDPDGNTVELLENRA